MSAPAPAREPALVRLLDLAGTSPNLRVDLRTRDVQGGVIYAHEDADPEPGVLERVWIRVRKNDRRGLQRWLCWTFRRDVPRRPSTVSEYSGLLIEENGRNVVTELSHDPYLLALEALPTSWTEIR